MLRDRGSLSELGNSLEPFVSGQSGQCQPQDLKVDPTFWCVLKVVSIFKSRQQITPQDE